MYLLLVVSELDIPPYSSLSVKVAISKYFSNPEFIARCVEHRTINVRDFVKYCTSCTAQVCKFIISGDIHSLIMRLNV